jgi:hypothetical protein
MFISIKFHADSFKEVKVCSPIGVNDKPSMRAAIIVLNYNSSRFLGDLFGSLSIQSFKYSKVVSIERAISQLIIVYNSLVMNLLTSLKGIYE